MVFIPPATCLQDILFSSVSDVGIYVNIRKLLDSIFNIYWRNPICRTEDLVKYTEGFSPVKLPDKGMMCSLKY
jgi:hypothetical protein